MGADGGTWRAWFKFQTGLDLSSKPLRIKDLDSCTVASFCRDHKSASSPLWVLPESRLRAATESICGAILSDGGVKCYKIEAVTGKAPRRLGSSPPPWDQPVRRWMLRN